MLVASTIRGSNATNHHLSSTNVRGLSLFLSLSLSLLYSNPKPKQLRLSLLSSLLSFCSLSSLLLLHHSLHRLHQTAGALLTAPSSSNHWSYHRWFGLSSPTRKASLSLSLSVCVSRTGRLSSSREAGSTSGTAYSRQLCPRTNLGDTIGIYPACLAAHKLMRLQCPWCRTYIPNELVCDTRCQVQVLDHLTYHNKNRSTCQRRLTIRISETKQNNTNYFTLVITVVVSSDGVCQQIKVMELEDSLK
ncbi:uncharacterized protein LOC114323379 isoform X1 [Camellia sinensis]|uniref:uncharacterized protein LOC114323379 isoform X1 n=1 Tax=Camellia sinensis TaxID=4442 RepID=UPI001036D4F4|nr:uncharacterized protein LOC114323379 isoform X1 [Camellia sinensis]